MHTHDSMCESKVIVIDDGERTVAMETAALIKIFSGSAICTDITGQEITLSDVELTGINLMKHEVLFKRGR